MDIIDQTERQIRAPEDKYVVPAVDQASRILLCLAATASPRLTLTEICSQVGVHKSRAFSVLHTLEGFGFVQKNTDGRGYSLGPGLIALSRKVIDNLSAPRLAEPILASLAEQTGSSAFLGLLTHQSLFVVAKHEGLGDIGITIRLGHRYPLTHGAHGKAIVAFMEDSQKETLLKSKDLYFHGAPSQFDRKRLKNELERCREVGYAEDLGEQRRGLNAIAAPVRGPSGSVIGAIFVLGLFAIDAAEQFGQLVAEGGKALSRLMGAAEVE
jgi:DNA-binding IclR family transcriptional regulator